MARDSNTGFDSQDWQYIESRQNTCQMDEVERLWQSRGYAVDLWRDPPGQEWEDFSHEADELIHVIEGEIEVEIEGDKQLLSANEEVFIPANAVHSIRNIGESMALWLYGYRTNS